MSYSGHNCQLPCFKIKIVIVLSYAVDVLFNFKTSRGSSYNRTEASPNWMQVT